MGEVNLREMLRGTHKEFNWGRISDEYSYIFDDATGIQKERLVGEPVIIHNQASRRFKKIINGG